MKTSKAGNMAKKISKKNRFLFILDPGHGGINPTKQEYVTSGKRSPKFDNGFVLYEGVENREKLKRIMDGMRSVGLDCIDIVNTWRDVPLPKRVEKANKLAGERECIYVSLHSDAYGNGKDWTSPKGVTVFSFKGSEKSREVAKIFGDNLKYEFEDVTNYRGLKESSFYVLRYTKCRAVLLELGFHTNKYESQLMITEEWTQRVVDGVVNSCLQCEKEL